MDRLRLFCAVFVVMMQVSIATGQTLDPPYTPISKEQLVKATSSTLSHAEQYLIQWRRAQSWQVLLTLSIAIAGIVAAALQRPKKQWARNTSLVLGLGITILTTTNQILFKIDYQTIARKKQEVTLAIEEVNKNLGLYDDTSSTPNRHFLADQILAAVKKIEDISTEVNPNIP